MPTATLPEPVAAYIAAANAQDARAVTACFAEHAVVLDEGHTRQGVAGPTVEVLHVEATDGRTVLAGQVSGNFPGSPVELRYVFTLDDGKIARLEIS
jgi:hypothetical protein